MLAEKPKLGLQEHVPKAGHRIGNPDVVGMRADYNLNGFPHVTYYP